jgi:citrate lyase subunit beta / citryl-CoA lyase
MAVQDSAAGPRGPGIGIARSLLFVPGDRADRFPKAARSGADAVVCDLEDAVAPGAKAAAREAVAHWLAGPGRAAVRVNAGGTAWYEEDCAGLAGLPGLSAVMVPKAEDPPALAALAEALGPATPVLALVETALGVQRDAEIAATPGVVRLAFGAIDFALDTGAEVDDLALLHARSSLVIASRSARIAAPVDGMASDLRDEAATASAARMARRLGFGGKLCVHPRQVGAVNAAFTPTDAEVRQARRIVAAAADGSAASLDEQMVDKVVVDRARMVLDRAALFAPPTGLDWRGS